MSRVIRSPEEKQHRRKKGGIIFFAAALLLGALLYGFSWVMSRPVFQIRKIAVTGNEILSAADIQAQTQGLLSGKFFYLVPRTNIFFYKKETIQKELRTLFPRIKTLSLSLNQDRNLIIVLSERKAAALWCGEAIPSSPDEKKCYYVDSSAFLFDEAPIFSGDAYFELYGKGRVTAGKEIGSVFADEGLFQNILSLRNEIRDFGEKPVNVFINDDDTAEFALSRGCKIRFNADQDFDRLRSNVEAVLKLYDWKNNTGFENGVKPCEALEYIDFRFGNKIYFLQKGKGAAEEESKEQIFTTEETDSENIVPEMGTSTPA